MTHGDTDAAPLLRVTGLSKVFDTRKGLVARLSRGSGHLLQALNGVDLEVARGQTLGLIGESGCGKSTLARVVLRLQEPSAGTIEFDGRDITQARGDELRALRRRMQIVFQDPYASLNPRKSVGEIVGLPLRIHQRASAAGVRDAVVAMLERVGLKAAHLNRYPHQFSGGQRQRIGIARALIVRPEFVVCDEPVSALDVSIQAQILHLLQSLQREFGLTLLFIGHNLSVVGYVSDHVAVMYLGEIVEQGSARAVFEEPQHPYTRSLIAAVPQLGRGSRPPIPIAGEPASPMNPPPGCRFHPRCPKAFEPCARVSPVLQPTGPGRWVACHLYGGTERPDTTS